MWHQWINHNFMTLREYFLCEKKKIMTSFNNFCSSMWVFDVRSRQYHNTCMWCSWCRSRCSDVEPEALRCGNDLQTCLRRLRQSGWHAQYHQLDLRCLKKCLHSDATVREPSWWRKWRNKDGARTAEVYFIPHLRVCVKCGTEVK